MKDRLREHKWLAAILVYAAVGFGTYLLLVTFEPLDGWPRGEQLALGQVVVAWLAVSIAIPAGYVGIRELRAALGRPYLRLQFQETQAEEIHVQRTGVAAIGSQFHIDAINRGGAITPWWQVTLYCPAELGASLRIDEPGRGRARWVQQPDSVWVFTSQGQDVVFRCVPLTFADYTCQIGPETRPDRYKLRYKFVTDRSPPSEGDLIVVVDGDDS